MIKAFQKSLKSLATAGSTEDDSFFVKNHKYAFTLYGCFMVFAGAYWSIAGFVLGYYWLGITSAVYLLLTLGNLRLFFKKKSLPLPRTFQVASGVLLPFVFQWLMGGFQASGTFLLWALPSALGGLTCTPFRQAAYWLYVFLLGIFVSIIIDNQLTTLLNLQQTPQQHPYFFSVNLAIIMLVVTFVASQFVNSSVQLQRVLRGQLSALNYSMGTLELDKYGRITFANDLFCRFLNIKKKRLLGKRPKTFLQSQRWDNKTHYKIFWSTLKQGISQSGEFEYPTPRDGSYWLAMTFTPVFSSENQLIKVIVIANNITENKRKKQEIEESNQRLYSSEEELRQNMEELLATQEHLRRVETEQRGHLAAINRTLAVAEYDVKGNIIEANTSFLYLMKYEREDLLGKHHDVLIDEYGKNEESYTHFWEELREGIPHSGDFKRVNQYHEDVWINSSYTPITDDNDNVIKIVQLANDITATEQQNIEYRARSDAFARFNTIVEFSLEGKVVHANDFFIRLSGYELEDVIGQDYAFFLPDREEKREVYKRFWSSVKRAGFYDGVFRWISKHGEDLWFRGVYSVLKNHDGEPLKIIKFAQDVSNEKLLEKQAQEQIEQIKTSEQELRRNADQLLSANENISKAKQHLEEITSFQKSILQSAELSIISTNLHGIITSFNPAAAKWLGYEASELIDKKDLLLFHDTTEIEAKALEIAKTQKKEVQSMDVLLGKALQGQVDRNEWTYIRKDGSKFRVLLTISGIHNDNDEIIGFLAVANDITEEFKQRQKVSILLKEAKQQQNMLSRMEKTAKVGAWEYDLRDEKGHRLVWSDQMFRVYEVPFNMEPTLDDFFKYYKEGDAQIIKEHFNSALKNGDSYELELQMVSAKGKEIWVRAIGKAQQRRGKTVRLSGTIQDITERKEIEEQQDRLVSILEASPNLVAMNDNKGRIIYINQGGKDMLGYPPEFDEFYNRETIDFQTAESMELIRTEGTPYAKEHGVWVGETEWVHKDGHEVPTSQIIVAHKNANGSIKYFSTVAFDISELKNQQQELVAARDILEDSLEELKAKNEILEASKRILSASNARIESSRVQLAEQSQKLTKQNKNITDSINYASRIQRALLTREQKIIDSFREAFILYLPKDIVSGDFYWYSEIEKSGQSNKKVLIAADCTGHGVPGALMTIIGNNILDDVINKQQILEPDQILYELDNQLVETLHTNSDSPEDSKVNDGMDISIMVIDEDQKQLRFAAAKNPLLYVRGGEIHQVRGSKFPIGSNTQYKLQKVFETHTIDIQPGDVFYMISDGFQDQFGGKNGKKYLTKRFRSLLLSISHLPMETQGEFLDKEITEWRGDASQTDDILVMGVKY
ncbi:PAS domain S-box protein [uncultured Microscilla sp.]|uniref:SpoIIE family protein phosphatase n=1 Tax=uncultured Microscilla sp. TaxID=432653 RepID=UPI002619421B|nr:PAS domain S-box protein [uncultured Microscilla sp.]